MIQSQMQRFFIGFKCWEEKEYIAYKNYST